MRTLRFNLPPVLVQKEKPVRQAISEPEAVATGSAWGRDQAGRKQSSGERATRSLPLPVLIPGALKRFFCTALPLAVLLVLSGFVTAVAAQTLDWETLRPEGEEFSIEMPKGSTTETGKEPYHKMELNTRVYLSRTPNGAVFAVASFSGIKSNPALYTEMQRFNSYVDAFKTLFPPKLKAKAAPGKAAPVKLTLVGAKALYGHAGREYQMSIGDVSGTVQTLVTRRRFYAVVYLNPRKDDAVKEQFLSSFVVPERMDQPAASASAQPTVAEPVLSPNTNDANGRDNSPNPNAAAKPGGPGGAGENKPAETEGEAKKGRSVAGGVLNGKALSLPKPDYPAEAKAAGASGAVAVQVTVDETGSVIEAKAVSGHVLLQAASVNAALQAKFAPTSLMGEPVKVTGVIIFNFAKQ